MAEQPKSAVVTAGTAPSDVHRRLVESYSDVLAGRLDEALELIDPDVVDHRGGTDGDHRGRAAWRQKWETLGATGFHGIEVTVEQNVSAGDTSANRYSSRGIHTATGRRYDVVTIDMIRVRDGRVVEHWAIPDQVAMRHQLRIG